ncbi:GTP diphosphokinase [Photobacterium sp. CCB-ST2H9]|uniref:GTP diphosphokinase n=1 Tax=unclassified Photobacterium TaxID=2628852 RepID=UPI002003891B|nr:GTP diphosphokinase [Photobacterium sp. CCB-ST2H9]UTM57813.1 GTP diphosphokinase [Photobacterium sp. CCB-ST2H9]
MVAVRGAHLKENVQFELVPWAESLLQDSTTSNRLIQTYQRCEAHLDNQAVASQMLWRGREMVEILVMLSMDADTLIAALLFPLVEAGLYKSDEVREEYGQSILYMVKGVKQMAAISQLNAIKEGAAQSAQVDNIRRMLLSMVDDFRCVVIKLAERICHLREVKDEPDAVRRAAARECANIYAPLANRLGIGQLKWEIEDYAFRYNHPETYKQIAKQLAERRIDREQYIERFVADLDESMKASHIKAEVHGRPKHIYSIWRKMQKKSLAFDELFDVRAVRIIADQLQDCYAALGVVHTKYRHLPKEFDDYVANPKPNGYQSIHTVVIGPEGKTIEIQIRTKQMHEESELGVAAHWKYKESGTSSGAHSAYDEKINWLRKLLAWQEEMSDSGEMLEELRSQVFDDRVYAFTPKGDVVDLPQNATPLDFAYHIHSEVGHRCIGAKVEGRIVPFTYHLQMGDQVEIITQKEPNPSRDWLNPNLGFVNSSRARAKVHAWFRKQDRDKNIAAGREILEQELHKIGATMKDAEAYALKRFNVNSTDELFAGVGSGDLRINQVINHINALVNKPTAEEEDQQLLERLTEASNKASQKKPQRDAVVVEGVDNLMTHLARCCQPIPGDDIAGFVTQGRGISVHRSDCEQLEELRHVAPQRIINTVWGGSFAGRYALTVRVTASERNGLIKDLTNTLHNEKVKVAGVKSRIDFRKQMSIMDFDVELTDLDTLGRVLKRLEQVKDVVEARRLH